ncbi:MAG: threonine--tRNA ligase [Thermoplasmata archaeon]
MRILFIHADRFTYEVTERTKYAEEVSKDELKGSFEDSLVSFISAEKSDEADVAAIAVKAADEIEDVAGQLKATQVVLYPYAHLSSSLARPEKARLIFERLEGAVRDRGLTVRRSPFGWYKAFDIAAKGHPLSELSREVTLEEEDKVAAAEERPHEFFVLTVDGKEREPKKYTSGREAFDVMVRKEALKEEYPSTGEPGYHRLTRKFGFKWESKSDAGHMRYDPKASLMYDLVADYAHQVVQDLGLSIYPLRGTNMFDLADPAVAEHAELFGDRLYTVETDKRSFVLRYAACHQQFSNMADWTISYRQLPLGAFEVADAYRFEQSGETSLLFRLRRLNMPDLHVLARDLPEAYDWFLRLHDRIGKEAAAIGREYELLVNVSSREAYEANKDLILKMLKHEGKEGLINIYPAGQNFYWTVNVEYHIEDAERRAREIATVQIDVGNAERFDITFADAEGKRQYPIILHTAILGSVERYLYTILDTAVAAEKEGSKGTLPLWLNPEQVRLLPVAEDHVALAAEVADALEGIRVGVDDRSSTVGKKVREAKQDWVGYVIVVGDREAEAGAKAFKVYVRQADEDREMTLKELRDEIEAETSGAPFRPLYFPREVSRRPEF